MDLHEECGVFGIISPVTTDVAGAISPLFASLLLWYGH